MTDHQPILLYTFLPMASVPVILPHHRYQVMIEPRALDRVGAITRDHALHQRGALIADSRVDELYGKQAKTSLQEAGYTLTTATMPPGEASKSLQTVREIYDKLLDDRLERASPVTALGGGVTGDTAGFVAATYLRGVPLIQCPTTLLAMVDASVGGKVGVNVPQGKNLIGAFHQPHAVVIDPLSLGTLPSRELRCGLAECVKHAAIADAELFAWTEQNLQRIQALDPDALSELIARNVRIKARIVMEDEKESGVRALLNFGHTFAHAIEASAGYGRLEHGEAVGLGMLAATRLAVDAGRCDELVLDRLRHLLARIGLPVRAQLPPVRELTNAMKLDKKIQSGRLRLILPRELGHVEIIDETSAQAIASAWQEIREEQSSA